MNSSHLWIAASTLLLASCASAPIVQPPAPLPEIPPLVLELPERNWQEEMQNFLRGTLPMQLDYKLPSKPVKPGMNP